MTEVNSSSDPQPKPLQRSILAMSMSQTSTSSGAAIVEKLTSEQLPLFFAHVENRENQEHKNTRLLMILTFIALVVILMIVWSVKDTNLTKEIIIALISFSGGGGLGFGIASNKK